MPGNSISICFSKLICVLWKRAPYVDRRYGHLEIRDSLSLTLCIKKEIRFFCSFIVTLFKPTRSLWLFLKQASFSTKCCLSCQSFIIPNDWKKRFLAAEILGRLKKNCFLLVAVWTKRSLSDIGKMNEPGQLVALPTPDDLQIFNILISIFGPTRYKAWPKQWASSYATRGAETISTCLSHQMRGNRRYK